MADYRIMVASYVFWNTAVIRENTKKKITVFLWSIAAIRENQEAKKAERVFIREFTEGLSEILKFIEHLQFIYSKYKTAPT